MSRIVPRTKSKYTRLYMVYGMKRSGNHAVINWIQSQEKFLFFNNLIPIGPILAGDRTMPESQDFEEFVRSKIRSVGLRRRLRQLLHAGIDAVAGKPCRYVMASLEDHDVTVQPFHGVLPPVTNVLILRDPGNLFASRLRKAATRNKPAYPRNLGDAMDRLVSHWKSHAREFLGDTAHLTGKVPISFESWFISEEYRKSTSERLGLEYKETEISDVSRVGGGSSFDGTDYDGNAQEMSVLNRPAQLEPHERRVLDRILEDRELQRLSRRYEEFRKGQR